MDKIKKITVIQFSLFILYILTFFTPIYSTKLWGSTFKASISELGAGTFFVILFLLLIVGTIVSKFAFKKYFNYVFLSTVGFMFLLLLILIFFKDSASTLRLSWYLHIMIIGILILSHFKEDLTLIIFDKIGVFIKNTFNKIVVFLKEKMKKKEETKTEIAEEKE